MNLMVDLWGKVSSGLLDESNSLRGLDWIETMGLRREEVSLRGKRLETMGCW